ncbi:MAG: hypothetical protein IGR80_17510 [Synechococcales cyanobacterium K44_A2020_017]|nr:hypothetical protein [Synechococcales cyanobacterium K32_A2020_035]MBF2096536.1 hypothetical protein [Synechococcales cyanobacterium K44_A2020_017]
MTSPPPKPEAIGVESPWIAPKMSCLDVLLTRCQAERPLAAAPSQACSTTPCPRAEITQTWRASSLLALPINGDRRQGSQPQAAANRVHTP